MSHVAICVLANHSDNFSNSCDSLLLWLVFNIFIIFKISLRVTWNTDVYKRQNIHLPVVRVSVLVTADDNYSDETINDLIVTNDTNGDLTKNNNVDYSLGKTCR